ncbi:MAG: hypothetical protein JXQ91_05410 [Vannielia sp.]|uniref:pilus assembly protein TadG-related protein n=1 Tax=Vannielia sp. TaxID=2813045 RepID=UPI003B8DCB98
MHATLRAPRVPARLFAFARNDEGGLLIFSLFLLACMMLSVGLAIDVMRAEMARTRLQNTADTAVLAAAAMEQTLDPRTVVEDYFAKAGLASNLESVSITSTANSRTVTANTNARLRTLLLGMVGIPVIEARSTGTATAGFTDVEVSLVLDISNSMSENGKMANLQSAAREFVDTVLDPDQPGTMALSIVPYTAQVAAGPSILNQLKVTSTNSWASCVDFKTSDYSDTAISPTTSLTQAQHFQHQPATSNPIDNPGCPQQAYEQIMAYSGSATALKTRINQLKPRHNTSIQIGMKWGVALLDPAFQPVVAKLVSKGEASPQFAERPFAYDRPGTMKVVVLMTDGENVDTWRIKSSYYDTTSERSRWHSYAVYDYAASKKQNWTTYVQTDYTASQADQMLSNICTAAKARGILIFSVGFEVTPYSASVMRNCATSPSHYFSVEGTQISEAFAAIARQISMLRLLY